MHTINDLIAKFEAHTGETFDILWSEPGPKNTRISNHYALMAQPAGRVVYVQIYEKDGWELFGVLCNANSVDETLDALAAHLAK